MSAALESFLTGFLGARAAKNERDQERADKEEDRIRALAQRGFQIAQQRTQLANAGKSMSDQLLSWGATPEMVQTALGQGAQGLSDFYKTVKGVHTALGAEGTKKYLTSPDGKYVQVDLGGATAVDSKGLYGLIERTYGMPTGVKVGDYKAPEQSFFGKIFGSQNYKERMLEELDAELSGIGGYSVYDLSTIGSIPDYLPGSGSITYKAPSIYSRANFSDEVKLVTDSATAASKLPAYDAAQKILQKANEDLAASSFAKDSTDYQEIKDRRDTAAREVNRLQMSAIQNGILMKGATYFNSSTYYEDMKGHLDSLGMDSSWLDEHIESENEIEKVVKKSLGGSGSTFSDPNVISPTAPVVTQTDTVLGEGETTITVEDKTLTVTKDGLVKAPNGTVMSKEDSDAIIKAAKEAGSKVTGRLSSKLDTKDGDMPKTRERRLKEKREMVGELNIAGPIKEAGDAVGAFTEEAILTTGEYSLTGLGAVAQYLGLDGVADWFYEKAIDVEDTERGEKSIRDPRSAAAKKGLENIKKQMQEGQDSSVIIDNIKKIAEDLKVADEENPMVKSVEAAIESMPDFVSSMGDAAKEAWFKLSQYYEGSKVQQVFDAIGSAQPSDREIMVQQVLDTTKRLEESNSPKVDNTSERETIEAFDRQFISDWKNMPATQKILVMGDKTKKKGMTEEETIRDLDRQFIKDWEGMPVRDKVIIRDVLYGKKEEEFTDAENKRLNEMRKTNPEWFIDTPPELLGAGMPASEVDTTYKSRTDRPTGLMQSIPPMEARSETGVEIDTAALDSALARAHGKGATKMQNFLAKVHSGKYTKADITRMIKETKQLPKTKAREDALAELYALRDSK